eukprot:5249331-Pyramimonas_sp.AAC.1
MTSSLEKHSLQIKDEEDDPEAGERKTKPLPFKMLAMAYRRRKLINSTFEGSCEVLPHPPLPHACASPLALLLASYPFNGSVAIIATRGFRRTLRPAVGTSSNNVNGVGRPNTMNTGGG